jgi:hypothetical protein
MAKIHRLWKKTRRKAPKSPKGDFNTKKVCVPPSALQRFILYLAVTLSFEEGRVRWLFGACIYYIWLYEALFHTFDHPDVY